MTTLLQQMAELPPNVTFATKNRWSRISFEVVRGRLNGFPVSVAHFEGGAALAVDPNDKSTLYAERFVFQDDVPSVVSGFEEQGALHWPEARKTLHHPAHIYWVEWKHKYEDNIVTIGVMVDTVLMRWRYPDSPVLMVFCASVSGGRAEPFCAMLTQDMPIEFPCWIKVPWLSLNGLDGQPETQEDLNEAQSLFYDFMYTLFMIVTPRVTEVVEVSHSPKLQKARAKSRKFPLLEYKKCQLQIGHSGVRYRTRSDVARLPGETEAEHHKRLHQVIGHFRTYTKGREQPRISWVPPHWRGDAKLGILVHERTVSKQISLPPLPPE
jgi:hypothetical protein